MLLDTGTAREMGEILPWNISQATCKSRILTTPAECLRSIKHDQRLLSTEHGTRKAQEPICHCTAAIHSIDLHAYRPFTGYAMQCHTTRKHSPHVRLAIPDLMMSFFLLRLLLKPIILLHSSTAVLSLSLNLHRRSLVRLQLIRDIGLLRRLGGLRRVELVHVSLGVVGFGRGRLVGFQFLEVEVLHEIRWGVLAGWGSARTSAVGRGHWGSSRSEGGIEP